MKNLSKVLISLTSIIAIFSILNPINVVITKNKKYESANDNNVSTRELAMLASLVYEDVPNDERYVGTTANEGCSVDKENGTVGSGCHFKALEANSASDLRLKGSKYRVWQYIEGLSERKMRSVVSLITSAFQEDGQKYYFLNFADTSEMDNWEIVHYGSKEMTKLAAGANIDLDWDGIFDAITFKKGNNYVIAYRGTDYPDLFEWGQDVAYALNGEHAQALLAYNYAQSEYERILKENPNANIYVTGHSLGAYLAQVGGAAIVEKASGKTDPYREPKDIQSLDDYTDYSPASNLKQVAYFNGMGVGGIFTTNNFTKNIDNALLYLSTHTTSGNLAATGRYVNYSKDTTKIQSSGRLVLYSMDADPISDIGLHYGEIYKLEVGADAVTNHHETHSSSFGTFVQKLAISGNDIFEKLNTVLPKLEKEYNNKFVSSVSENLYSLIKSNQQIDSSFKYLPSFVEEALSLENNGKVITNYGLGSLLANLTNDVSNFSIKNKNMEITNVFDHFNMNHETDSFTCLIDSNNGKITGNKINLEVSSDTMNCKDGTCYTNKEYTVDSNYQLGSDVYSEDQNNIILTANVTGGCAKNYEWYYSQDNVNFATIGKTVRNKIIIPKEYLNMDTDETKTIYFKVSVNYGDKYQETKVSLADNSLLEYEKVGETTTNPTLSDGISTTGGRVESNPIKISMVYDTVAPVCYFPNSKATIKLETGTFGIAKKTYTSVRMICKDELSGMDIDASNDNKFRMDANTAFLGLNLVIINKDRSITKSKVGDKDMNVYVPVIALRKPVSSKNHAILYYKGGYTDMAGNIAPAKNMDIYVTK